MNRRMCLVIMATIAGVSPKSCFRVQKPLSIFSPNWMRHLFTYNCLVKGRKTYYRGDKFNKAIIIKKKEGKVNNGES
jgi:hypothetical protein